MDTTTECIIYLFSLTSSIQDFTTALTAELPEKHKPILTTKAAHWIFPPTILSVNELTANHWDVTVCFKAPFPTIPPSLLQTIKSSWSISFAAPTALLASLPSMQSELTATSTPPRSREFDLLTDSDFRNNDTVSSVDSAEITTSLKSWIQTFTSNNREEGVIMFNLMAFKDREKYRKYQDGFVAGVGTRHGSKPLLFGEVVESGKPQKEKSPWDMAAFIYYPSVLHFADMLSSPDYKEISHKYRRGSLVDNPILCLVNI